MRRLELPFNGQRKDLTQLHPKILCDAVVKLENADDLLRLIKMTAEQIVDLMIKIRDTKDLRIIKLPLYSHNISQVPPGVWASVITRMENVCPIPPVVTPLQLAAIFTSLASQQGEDIKLKSLNFLGVYLTFVSLKLLVEGILRLQEIRFTWSTITADQANAILSMVSEGCHQRLNIIRINEPTIIGGTISPTGAASPGWG